MRGWRCPRPRPLPWMGILNILWKKPSELFGQPNVQVSRLSKEGALTHVGGAAPTPLRPWTEQTGNGLAVSA